MCHMISNLKTDQMKLNVIDKALPLTAEMAGSVCLYSNNTPPRNLFTQAYLSLIFVNFKFLLQNDFVNFFSKMFKYFSTC